MRTSQIFQPENPAALSEFIRRQPLALLVSTGVQESDATALPLLAETDADGSIVAFIGHMALSNPHVRLLQQNPRAMATFLGAHGYISPSWMADRTQAPTWNFEMANFLVDVSFAEKQAETVHAVNLLVDAMEEGRPGRWRAAELGARYDVLIKHVVGFTARVVDARIKFKMGQNERSDVYDDILAGLEKTEQSALAGAMRKHNRNR